MDLKDKLRAVRTSLSKTQEQVARESGMTITQYNGYERGRSRPAPATLQRIAAALQTTPEALQAGSQQPGQRNGLIAVRKLRAQFQAECALALGFDAGAINIRIEIV